MRTRKFPALIALLVAFAAVTAGAAGAQTASETGTVEATAVITQTDLDGYRYISSFGGTGTADPTTDPATQLTPGAITLAQIDDTTLEAALGATVTELNVNGANPWNLRLSVSTPFTNTTSGNSETIDNAHVVVKDRALTSTPSLADIGVDGGNLATSFPGTEPLALSSEVTLFNVANQDPSALYTGDWVSTSNVDLNLPNGVVAGTYEAELTVTLYE